MIHKLALLFGITLGSVAAHAACHPGRLAAGDARLRVAAVEDRVVVVAQAIVDACRSDLPLGLRGTLEQLSTGDSATHISAETVEQWLLAHGAGKQRAHRWALEIAEPVVSTHIGGGFGIVGAGRGGGGTGEGTIGLGHLAARVTAAPSTDSVTVRGSLDREVIDKIIQRHTNEVRSCYESSSSKGLVMVQFTIGHTGEVIASVIQSSTIGSPEIEECITTTVKSWVFPKPANGSIAIVSYPVVLKSAQ